MSINNRDIIKFSVLMSVYYKEKAEYLKQSIDSLLNQSLLPSEIIIVKDGPLTEELDKCIKEFENKYHDGNLFKIIELEKNVGLGKALNEGMKYCSYDYVARMDSDDISLPDRFEKQIAFLKEHPDCDVIGGYIIEFDNETNEDISARIVPCEYDEFVKFQKTRNPMNHVTVLFNKNSVNEAGGYIDCLYFEDYYLWIRMFKSGKKLMNMNDTLVRVRAGKDMTSRRGSFKYISCIWNFEKRMLDLKLISVPQFLYVVLSKSVVALLPNGVRYAIYQKKLRK